MTVSIFIACLIGLLLDLYFGDPRNMPHLVKVAGKLVPKLETLCVKMCGRSILGGVVIWLSLNGLMLGSYLLIRLLAAQIHPWLTIPVDAIVVFQSVAFTDLVKHIEAIAEALQISLEKGRERVSWIVGRDTSRMDAGGVCRATIESGSENYNDGAIAPLFWLILLGPVGALLFRMCNTLDAMIGHRNERFEKIGKFSARVDDVMNFIPARLCSLIIFQSFDFGAWWKLRPDARQHPSWNAGWPEAAMAKRLGVVIGGEMYLHGKLVQTKTMNTGAPQPSVQDIYRCTQVLRKTYTVALLVTVSLLALQTAL